MRIKVYASQSDYDRLPRIAYEADGQKYISFKFPEDGMKALHMIDHLKYVIEWINERIEDDKSNRYGDKK